MYVWTRMAVTSCISLYGVCGGEGSSMCGVARFGSSKNSLLDTTATSRYREVTFRAEEGDLSSRRGRA